VVAVAAALQVAVVEERPPLIKDTQAQQALALQVAVAVQARLVHQTGQEQKLLVLHLQ
jgi:hypothetical protein